VLVLLVIVLSSDDDDTPEEPTATQPTVTEPAQNQPVQPQLSREADPSLAPRPTRPDPSAAVDELERTLRRQRFWSSMELAGANLDVRSASCDDAGMRRTLDGAAPALRGAGLTRLRCLAQSGAVVFERDL
jgi:hypothetical protein